MLLQEIVALGDTMVEIALDADLSYRLAYADLVVYEKGRRTVRGRSTPYAFRSVEQLRYDFERDVAAVGGRLG